MSATFQDAHAASFYTGTSIIPNADAMGDLYTGAPTERFVEATNRAIAEKFSSCHLVKSLTTTLLRNSEMFGLIGSAIGDINTFAELFIQVQESDSLSPRDVVARLSGYMEVEDADELVRFVARNKDIAIILEKVVSKTSKHPKFANGELSVFSEPDEADYSVHINAEFSLAEYSEAYELEGLIFEEAIKPHFDLVNYRIMLSFDTDDDD